MTEQDVNQIDYSTVNYDTVVQKCLSDDVRRSLPESWKKFAGKGMDDVFKSHLGLEKEMSRRVRMPDANTSEEDRRKFFTQLGCPDSEDGYDFSQIDFGPERNDEGIKGWRKLFHQHGIPKAVGEVIAASAAQIAGQQRKVKEDAKTQLKDETEKALREKYPGEKYDKFLAKAQVFYDKHMGDNFAKFLQEQNLHLHPVVIEAFGELAEKVGDMDFAGGGGTQVKTAEQKLDDMYPDKK